MAAARRFIEKAMRGNGAPTKIAMDKSGANKAAIDEINSSSVGPISVRHILYLNNLVVVRFRGIANRYLITFKMAKGLDARGLTTPALLLQAAVQIG